MSLDAKLDREIFPDWILDVNKPLVNINDYSPQRAAKYPLNSPRSLEAAKRAGVSRHHIELPYDADGEFQLSNIEREISNVYEFGSKRMAKRKQFHERVVYESIELIKDHYEMILSGVEVDFGVKSRAKSRQSPILKSPSKSLIDGVKDYKVHINDKDLKVTGAVLTHLAKKKSDEFKRIDKVKDKIFFELEEQLNHEESLMHQSNDAKQKLLDLKTEHVKEQLRRQAERERMNAQKIEEGRRRLREEMEEEKAKIEEERQLKLKFQKDLKLKNDQMRAAREQLMAELEAKKRREEEELQRKLLIMEEDVRKRSELLAWQREEDKRKRGERADRVKRRTDAAMEANAEKQRQLEKEYHDRQEKNRRMLIQKAKEEENQRKQKAKALAAKQAERKKVRDEAEKKFQDRLQRIQDHWAVEDTKLQKKKKELSQGVEDLNEKLVQDHLRVMLAAERRKNLDNYKKALYLKEMNEWEEKVREIEDSQEQIRKAGQTCINDTREMRSHIKNVVEMVRQRSSVQNRAVAETGKKTIDEIKNGRFGKKRRRGRRKVRSTGDSDDSDDSDNEDRQSFRPTTPGTSIHPTGDAGEMEVRRRRGAKSVPLCLEDQVDKLMEKPPPAMCGIALLSRRHRRRFPGLRKYQNLRPVLQDGEENEKQNILMMARHGK